MHLCSCLHKQQTHTSNKMKYLSNKNRATETAPDITGDMNHDETTMEQQHTMTKHAVFLVVILSTT